MEKWKGIERNGKMERNGYPLFGMERNGYPLFGMERNGKDWKRTFRNFKRYFKLSFLPSTPVCTSVELKNRVKPHLQEATVTYGFSAFSTRIVASTLFR